MLVKLLIFAFTACLFRAVVSQRDEDYIEGEWSDVEDHNSEEFQTIVHFAEKEISKLLKRSNKFKVRKIISAREQVVEGHLFEILMKIGETICKKDVKDKDCNFKPDGETYKCKAVVWERVWMKFIKLTSYNCKKQKNATKKGLRRKQTCTF